MRERRDTLSKEMILSRLWVSRMTSSNRGTLPPLSPELPPCKASVSHPNFGTIRIHSDLGHGIPPLCSPKGGAPHLRHDGQASVVAVRHDFRDLFCVRRLQREAAVPSVTLHPIPAPSKVRERYSPQSTTTVLPTTTGEITVPVHLNPALFEVKLLPRLLSRWTPEGLGGAAPVVAGEGGFVRYAPSWAQ